MPFYDFSLIFAYFCVNAYLTMAEKTKIISPYEGFQEKFVRSNVDFVIGGGAVSAGKEHPLYTRVLTPNGWKRIGDLKEGDYVCTPFGEPSKVMQIFEHKNRDIYEVETSDGRKARCGLEHLWSFRTERQLNLYYSHKDMTKGLITEETKKLIKRIANGERLYLPVPNAQEFQKKEFPIRPYALGNSYIYMIPEEYMFGSITQREMLFYGLMARYGSELSDGDIKFSTNSERLAEDIVYLSRSLGYYALQERTNAYVLQRMTDIRHVPILKINNINEKSDTRCIWIDDPLHLYIVDDFIVTHNTAAAVMTVAEPSLDPKFRAVFLRNNLGDLKSGGGVLDEFRKIYGSWVNVVESGDPHVDFPSGARIDVTHIADQTKDKVLQRFKGRQYDMIYFDEGTGFTWVCLCAVFTRNRGVANWTGKVRMTTNPKKNHWLRTFLDWYIGADGYIIPERDGVVRYFFINGETVNDVVWGDTKEEVYNKCRINIDRILARFNGRTGKSTYKDIIKSFTFYEGKMSGNKAILGNNSGYVGSVAVLGGREAQANLEGNWNVDTDEDDEAVITNMEAEHVFMNDPQMNNDKWVTCDLADTGTDNFLCLAWNGFHVYDYLIMTQSTPRQNAEMLELFAKQHDISNSHIIYDGIRGTYINDYIPEAIPFFSYYAPCGLYSRMAYNLKSECYLRLVNAIKKGYMSIDDKIGQKIYNHADIKQPISIAEEFREECSVIRFKEMSSGKKALLSKKEMNSKLGKGRSMDFLDPCAMRFYPVLEYAYGEELIKTTEQPEEEAEEGKESIYDETLYG